MQCCYIILLRGSRRCLTSCWGLIAVCMCIRTKIAHAGGTVELPCHRLLLELVIVVYCQQKSLSGYTSDRSIYRKGHVASCTYATSPAGTVKLLKPRGDTAHDDDWHCVKIIIIQFQAGQQKAQSLVIQCSLWPYFKLHVTIL